MDGSTDISPTSCVASPQMSPAASATSACLSRAEERTLLDSFNQTAAHWPRGATIHGLFEQQVALHAGQRRRHLRGTAPYLRALLNERANRVHVFCARVCGPGHHRGHPGPIAPWDMISAILGILKAGGCYLPISTIYPADFASPTCWRTAGTKLLLTRPRPSRSGSLRRRVHRPRRRQSLSGTGRVQSRLCQSAARPGYIIYTSGFHGKPKGVMLDHHKRRSFDVQRSHQCPVAISAARTCGPCSTRTAFRLLRVGRCTAPLLYGGRLVIVPRGATLSPPVFLQLLVDERSPCLNQTPARSIT